MDDGSTDAGPSIVKRFAETHAIRLLVQSNRGQSPARNLGVSHSKCRLIAFLDQDDLWYPRHLEELVAPFFEPRGAPLGWVYSNLDRTDANGMITDEFFLRAPNIKTQNPKRLLADLLRHDMYVLPSASLIARQSFEAVGGFDERLMGYEDDDLFLRMFCAGHDNVYIDKPLSQWRLDKTSSSFRPTMDRSRQIFAAKLLASFPEHRGLIAQRFMEGAVEEFVRALTNKDQTAMASALGHLALYAPDWSIKRRLAFLIGAPPA